MAGNTIAKGSVLISLNADQFASGIDSTQKKLGRLASGAGKISGSGFMKHFGAAMAIGGPVALAAVAVEGAQALGEAAKAFATGILDTIGDLGKMGAISQAMGMTPEAFTGIAGVAKLAGEDTREFIESLVTMGKLGADAAAGVGEIAGPAFEKLNLNAKEFIGLSPDKQFFAMFDALSKLPPSLERTRLLMNAFGEDGGKYLLPILGKTGAELKNMAKEFALSSGDIAKAQSAQMSINRVSAFFSAAWKKIAIAFAPVVEAVANGLSKMSSLVAPFFGWVERRWNDIVGVVQDVWGEFSSIVSSATSELQPIFDWMSRGWEEVTYLSQAFFGGIKEVAGAVWQEVKGIFAQGWAFLKDNFSGVFSWVDDLPSIESVIQGFFRAIGTSAAYTWDTFKAGAGVILIVAGNIVKGFAKVIEVFQELSDLGSKIPREFRPKEVNDFIDGIKNFRGKAGAFGEGLVAEGDKALNSWGNSAKQFNSWFDTILGKSRKVNENIVEAASNAVAMDKSTMKLSEALSPNSKEAYSMTIKNQFRDLMGKGDDDKKKQLKAAQGTEKNTGKTAKDTNDIMKFVSGLGSF